MTVPKGGRGKKAPYETTQMRVPVPIKDQVSDLIAKFRGEVFSDLKTDENLFESVDNTKISAEIESLQIEILNLKTALETSETEKLNLKTALQETNQQIENLSTSLEEEKQKAKNLSTGKLKTDFEIDHRIGEGEALKRFNLERKILRNPRDKGEIKVNFKHEDKFIYLEYIGQPDGKGSTHYWQIVKVEEAPQNLSLTF